MWQWSSFWQLWREAAVPREAIWQRILFLILVGFICTNVFWTLYILISRQHWGKQRLPKLKNLETLSIMDLRTCFKWLPLIRGLFKVTKIWTIAQYATKCLSVAFWNLLTASQMLLFTVTELYLNLCVIYIHNSILTGCYSHH